VGDKQISEAELALQILHQIEDLCLPQIGGKMLSRRGGGSVGRIDRVHRSHHEGFVRSPAVDAAPRERRASTIAP
jgi:hypothetical protein